MTSISDLLGIGEIIGSAELARRIRDTGKSDVAARKIISRSADPAIWKLPVRTPGRGGLFAHRESQHDKQFYLEVAKVLDAQRPGLARLIRSLTLHEVLLRADAQRVLASPFRRGVSRTPSFDFEVGLLSDLGFCGFEGRGTSLERLSLKRLVGTTESQRLAKEAHSESLIANKLAAMLADHFRKTAVFSWNSALLPTDGEFAVEFNNYPFSARAFTFLDPLMRREKGKKPRPAPVVMDVLDRECTADDVNGFIHRLRRISNNPHARLPVLGIFAATEFQGNAWSVAKDAGLYAINLRQFYGETALVALAQAERLLGYESDSGKDLSENADALCETLEKLHHHPYVYDLRSIGFEVACGLILRSDGWEDVQLGLKVPWHDTQRDIDVIGKRRGGQHIAVIECKAEREGKELSRDAVKKFFTETVPAVLKSRQDAKTCTAELWTTGAVGEDARAMLRETKVSDGVTVDLVSRDDLLARIPPYLGQCGRLIKTVSMPV